MIPNIPNMFLDVFSTQEWMFLVILGFGWGVVFGSILHRGLSTGYWSWKP
jgi:hypothetical protein